MREGGAGQMEEARREERVREGGAGQRVEARREEMVRRLVVVDVGISHLFSPAAVDEAG